VIDGVVPSLLRILRYVAMSHLKFRLNLDPVNCWFRADPSVLGYLLFMANKLALQ